MDALVYDRMKMKYVWMNEADSAKEGSLVEVPYVEPLFMEVLMSIPWFQGLMAYEWMIWKMLCSICNMICAVCKMISLMMHVTLMTLIS